MPSVTHTLVDEVFLGHLSQFLRVCHFNIPQVNLTLPTGDNVVDSLVAKGYAQRISAPRIVTSLVTAMVTSSVSALVTSSCYKSPKIELGVATDATVAYVTNYNEVNVDTDHLS